ncbi:hypothetical protein F4820DRAFT_466968 [Hypoxylon rubiginosum]|uniref:Uncharacterized protein n=1 Tax=Hypoxylon rubiginosum TaxID=110542 RepID=A0ACB9YKT3_9PEZI|nr:hypothetical protein F4820DRAFT_466968 [Hypoxylon rubiginosum]
MASYPGIEKIRGDALKEVKNVESAFQKAGEKRFKIKGVLGEGTGGVALKMAMISKPSPTSQPVQEFILKRAYNTEQEAKLRKEIAFVQRFRGDMHVAQFFSLEGEPIDSISYLKGPTLLTEWIGNGTLKELIVKRADWGKPLPNRMLWRLFLCLCRMLIAMAWPSDRPPGTKRESERVPSPNENGKRPDKLELHHGDLNIQNILIGNLDLSEHAFVNTLIIIDFGASSIEEDETKAGQAAKVNISKMGEIMLNLIGGRVMKSAAGSSNMNFITVEGQNTIRSWARDLDGLNPVYKAPASTVAEHKDRMDNLDPDLRRLVIRCLATAMNNRPELEDLVEEVERNVSGKAATYYASYRYGSNETNSEVARIMKELLHDATTS